ncbi:MAG: helix-hairpin-helix domain-containing protein [Bryobacteraceae bacterium]
MGQARTLERADAKLRAAAPYIEETPWERKRSAAPKTVIANLSRIPGVGPSIAADLYLLGIRDVAELRGRNPEALYEEFCHEVGQPVDRCLLYTFRCAVYYASAAKPEPEMLKWWNWKDGGPAAAAAGVRPVNSRKSRIR